MAKKRQEEPPKGSPAWMSTFSDLMNLLLCFFVLLFSMSTVDAQKFEAVAASFSQTFSIFEAGATAIGDGILISNGVSQLNELDKYINSTGKSADTDTQSDALEAYQAASMEQAEQMAENIEESLQEDHGEYNSDISVDFTSQYVSLNLNGAFCLIRAVIRSGKRQSRFWTRWDRYWNVMRTVRSRLKVIRTMCRSITPDLPTMMNCQASEPFRYLIILCLRPHLIRQRSNIPDVVSMFRLRIMRHRREEQKPACGDQNLYRII